MRLNDRNKVIVQFSIVSRLYSLYSTDSWPLFTIWTCTASEYWRLCRSCTKQKTINRVNRIHNVQSILYGQYLRKNTATPSFATSFTHEGIYSKIRPLGEKVAIMSCSEFYSYIQRGCFCSAKKKQANAEWVRLSSILCWHQERNVVLLAFEFS